MWQFIMKNDPTVNPNSKDSSELSAEDFLACLDLVEVVLVDYRQRLLENVSTKALLQFMLFLLCHLNWDIRKAAHDTTKNILVASPLLSEALLHEFWDYLSVVVEKVALKRRKCSIPYFGVLVKALVVIASALSASTPDVTLIAQLLFCSHHPHIIGTSEKNAVWRRVQMCSQKKGFDVIGFVTSNVAELCEVLFSSKGLMNSNRFEQDAAINTLSTLMSTPEDIYAQFEKHFTNHLDLIARARLSETDIQRIIEIASVLILFQTFLTSEGMLLIEKHVISSHSTRRDVPNTDVIGAAKKVASEPPGNLAIKFFNPLMRSPIFGESAFEALVKLSSGTVVPCSSLGHMRIATALRLIVTKDPMCLLAVTYLLPSFDRNKKRILCPP
ncbi:hypothetical protein PHJA_001298700 [Phtheirospermum japonicum]|uniref:Uncharacterized protein n=1 Tax=Phtheirospermum japonicum TaxID=374723 RepID=A0A830BU96_9LAMI|nr:hypothetical protein PHJA_001298700 [Phtheirospermum japonicum]